MGSSMGARLAPGLARRGVAGATLSPDPDGFWSGWRRNSFYFSIALSIRLVHLPQPVMPLVTGSAVGRTLLFNQFSTHPWRLSAVGTLEEMRRFAASLSFDQLLHQLAYGPEQKGAAPGSTHGPIVIGWGRKDRVCLPSQAARAMELFPDARLFWFENCGQFPQWDVPRQAASVVSPK